MNIKALLDIPPWDWPTDAGVSFGKILRDSRASESERLIAAELAGVSTVIDDNLADALLVIVGSAHEPEQIRAKAAISLGPVLELADTDGFEDDPDDVPIAEGTFRNIQKSLQKLYLDNGTPKLVRRRILEASVRAPQAWHQDAIEQAYSSGDKEWRLTAVFSMRWVRGFDDRILAALESGEPEIQCQAVYAAGNWGLDAAWPHIVELVNDAYTPKNILLAAIGAVGTIHPAQAHDILADLADSDDEEIAEEAEEAMAMAEAASEAQDDDDDDDDNEEEWMN